MCAESVRLAEGWYTDSSAPPSGSPSCPSFCPRGPSKGLQLPGWGCREWEKDVPDVVRMEEDWDWLETLRTRR